MVKWRRIWTTEVPIFHRQGKCSTKKQVAPWNYSSSSLLSEIMPHLSSVLKSRDITLPKKVCIIKAVVFPVVMYGCESRTIKKAEHRRIYAFELVLEKTLESPLDCKIKSLNPKRNQPWIFTGRTDAEAEAPILCPPDAKSRLIGKDPDARKDWGQKRQVTEDKAVG